MCKGLCEKEKEKISEINVIRWFKHRVLFTYPFGEAQILFVSVSESTQDTDECKTKVYVRCDQLKNVCKFILKKCKSE